MLTGECARDPRREATGSSARLVWFPQAMQAAPPPGIESISLRRARPAGAFAHFSANQTFGQVAWRLERPDWYNGGEIDRESLMPRRRISKEQAAATGAAKRNPGRFANRSAPTGDPLGEASGWMSAEQSAVWERFQREFPWLQESDRCLVEIATFLRTKVLAGEDIGAAGLAQLRLCISSMGGTPGDRARLTLAEEREPDPLDRFFN
jgi:hypothetical protein